MDEHTNKDSSLKSKNEKIAAAKKKLKSYQTKTPKFKDNTFSLNSKKSSENLYIPTTFEDDLSAKNNSDLRIIDQQNEHNVNFNSGIHSMQIKDEANNDTDNKFIDFNQINFNLMIPTDTSQNQNISLQNYFINSVESSNDNDFFTEIGTNNTYSEVELPNQSGFTFNMLSMPENHSETISTISERTENDSTHGVIGGNLESDTVDETQGTPLHINENLNSISTEINVISLTEEQNIKLDHHFENQNNVNIIELEQKADEYKMELEKEKIQNENLSFKIESQASLIEELNIEIKKLQHEKSNSLGYNIVNLQEQLENQIKTIGILVGEKSELTCALQKTQSVIKDQTNNIDELQSRLSASRHKVTELERELNHTKTSFECLNISNQNCIKELETIQQQYTNCKKLYDDSAEELQILNQKIIFNNKEIEDLHEEIKFKNSELTLYKLRIEQLTSGGELNSLDATQITELSRLKENSEKQISDYQKLIEQFKLDKEQTDQHYQNYLQHMHNEMANLSSCIQELNIEKEHLVKRETDLVKHIGELEKNLQIQLSTNREALEKHSNQTIGSANESYQLELNKLNEKISDLQKEEQNHLRETEVNKIKFEKLELEISKKNEMISQLELTIERLKSNQPDTSNLIISIESERLAASRAVAQNMELKNQLEEMQKAFVQISNDKLELTDKLQTEQHLCRELKSVYDEIQNELSSLKETFALKDEEMIRLAHENTELGKQVLLQTQELDRFRHYESSNHMSNVLQDELKHAKNQILYLKSQINEREIQKHSDNQAESVASDENPTVELSLEATEDAEVEQSNHNGPANQENEEQLMSSCNFMIASHEAMEKLQQRFRKTMDEMADLTEEKQKLEHLVLQLQDETETIGEYVALYQTQRRLLKQREIEKDIELHKLSEDREQMKEKLLYLNQLIEQLLHEKNGSSLYNSDKNLPYISKDFSNTMTQNTASTEGPVELQAKDSHSKSPKSTQTAVKILNLLEEIKIVNNSMSELQHCSCCSGKLETV